MNQYLVVGIVFIVVIALLATNKKLVETLKNIYKIEELRKRVLYTIGLLLVYRLGSFVVIPGINPNALGEGSAYAGQLEGNSLLGLLDVFSGGAFGNAAIFALGVMPYITASIVIQLMGMMIPYFQKMQKEGESGRRKMNQWTRLLTIVVLVIQGPAYIANLYHQVPSAFVYGNTWQFVVYATVILIAGTMFIMWLGEKITDKGIGNGISLIIMIGIVARLPHALLAEVNARFQTASGSAIMLILELVLLFLVFMATIALVQAVRKVPVQYAKRIIGNKQYGGVRQYIPLKMNAANVMPIIFAQALMFIPALFTGTAFAAAFSSMTGFWYNITLAVLVIAFTYFYTAIIINPQMMADDMKRNGGFIPGVKPGKQTVNYIDTIMTRITLPGSFFLAIVAILPALAMKFLGIQQSFAYFYGGTSLLIMVGVVLMVVIEPFLLHFWGTTPGKWLFGMEIRTPNGEKLAIRTGFYRTWQVFTGGMGWDLPIWGWYRLYKSYQASTAGELPWDIDNGCHIVVHERKTKWYRVLMFLFAWLLVLAAEFGISLYADLPRNTGRLTFAQYVDNCNNVLKYHELGWSMRSDGSLGQGWDSEGGIITIDSATYTPEVTAETDANGYVTAVELHIDTDNVVIGTGTDVKEMLYYGYALPHEKKTMLAMTDEMLQNTEDFTATLGSLTITQKVTFENCTVIGEGENRIYWPEEGKTSRYTMDLRIAEN